MIIRELSFSEKRDWLRLIRTPNVGPEAFQKLIQRYKTARAAIEALPGLTRKKPLSLPPLDRIEAEMEACQAQNIHILAMCEPDYPTLLRAIDPPPPLLMLRGHPSILHQRSIAIIGSRNASAIGQKFTRQIAGELGEAGFSIISGMARGIDRMAHLGAMKSGTAAVLGGGVDHIYPYQNTDIFQDIVEQGCIISESP